MVGGREIHRGPSENVGALKSARRGLREVHNAMRIVDGMRRGGEGEEGGAEGG